MCIDCGRPGARHELSAEDGNSGDAGNTGVYRIVAGSGAPMIDGVLSGVAWKYTNFSVAYPTNAFAFGFNYGQGESATFQAFNQAQRLAADFARNLIQDYAPITYIDGTESNANLRYGNFQADASQSTHGYYPDGGATMGDLWFSQKNGDQFTAAIGSFAMATILHEQGHTFGLKHPQDPGIRSDGGKAFTADNVEIPNLGAMPAEFDNWNYSLMTYRSYAGAPTDPIQGFLQSDNPTTYMMADIAALQYMYGANFSGFSSSNTLYQWDDGGNFFENGSIFLPATTNGKVLQTIWDGGGNDTYDTSNFNTNQVIDLRPGQFSTFAPIQVADLDRFHPGTHLALGNIANALLFNNDPRSLVENAATGAGNDQIIGNIAANALAGGAGNDILRGLEGNDTLDGGPGTDTADYSGNTSAQPIFVSLITGDGYDGLGGKDPLSAIENVAAGAGNDAVVGNGADNSLAGAGGSDALFGGSYDGAPGSGKDSLDGGGGNDGLWGFDGADSLNGGADDDGIVGGAGNDTLSGGAGIDVLFGGDFAADGAFQANSGDDVLNGGDGGDGLWGFDGNDAIQGEGGDDYAQGGPGNDSIFGGADADTLLGEAGNDGINGGPGFDYLYGGAGADTFVFLRGDSFDTIWDFSAAEGDRLRVDAALGLASFADFQSHLAGFTFEGADYTVLSFPGILDQLTIKGIAFNAWTPAMVDLA